ncbi:hypothetical protein ACWDHW_08730 [Streptomyces melanosporofaciens]
MSVPCGRTRPHAPHDENSDSAWPCPGVPSANAPDTFDEITSFIAPVCPWNAAWDESEQRLLDERPQGFHPEDIGRGAFERLHEVWRPAALDVLFYAYYEARKDHPEELARFEAAQPLRAKASEALTEVEALLARGAEVTPELVTTLVSLSRTLIGGAR